MIQDGILPPGGDIAEMAFVVLLAATDDQDKDLLGILNDVLATYKLDSAIGPISGPGTLDDHHVRDFLGFDTTAGTFEIDALSSPVSFTAAPAVPEPSSLALALVGSLAGLGYSRRRRQRLATA